MPTFTITAQEARCLLANYATKESEMTTITLSARYARYLLTSLATIAFGINMQ